ncbi:hypothetical protein NZK35_18880 [Stieleria sp. ICT_E10.1]|uniref:hypothetical protein n=1 Tax=Stieleria sedimenti TaxID=2976331 RepID=UPI0021806715|nr:hypothetical protein [Stieleria sedimenti]MCS7468723.1 hypothetical protein [Stieleria sedimenti]
MPIQNFTTDKAMLIAVRVSSVLLILIGFTFAALSHPMWHPMSVASDKVIERLLFSGIACTFVGILVFFGSIRGLDRRTKRLWLIPGLLILLPVVGLLWFRFFYVPPFTVAQAGSRITPGALSLRTPTMAIVPSEAGVVFGTVTLPGEQERLAFLIFVDYGGDLSRYSSFTPNSMGGLNALSQLPDGKWTEVSVGFSVGETPFDAKYYIELDDSLTEVATETLSVGEKSYDASAGRVFLVDLTVEPHSCRQVNVTMPPVPAKLETRDEILRTAKALRETLAERDPAINQFLD